MSRDRFGDFALRIRDHEEEAEIIRMGLAHNATPLIHACQDTAKPPLSLRKLAAAVGCSACYLSRIMMGQERMSPRLFTKLAEFVERREADTRRESGEETR